MYRDENQLVRAIYEHFSGLVDESGNIPFTLRPPKSIGKVQDDPFDSWIAEELESNFPILEVVQSNPLTSPDVVIRDRETNVIIAIEVKKLVQEANGKDPRGMTMDYNSTLPCGKTQIRIGKRIVSVPCYYLFALHNPESTAIVTFILMDGDFLNNDFELYKYAKIANKSSYGHGPYKEGSVRGRAMYTYVNPLNWKLDCFFGRKTLVVKAEDCESMDMVDYATEEVIRTVIYDAPEAEGELEEAVETEPETENFSYFIVDALKQDLNEHYKTLLDIFADAKARKGRARSKASMPTLDEI